MLYSIYALIDPRTEQPFYVGVTSNPGMRISKHRTEKKGATRKKGTIAEIQAAGLQPRMDVLERVTDNPEQAREREQYWIQEFEMQGIYLTNVVHSVINDPVHVTKTQKRARLTFDWMDAMWKKKIDAEETTMPLLDQLDKFINSFQIDETWTPRERQKFEIWRDCKRSQTRHPEHFPFCNL